MVQESKHIHCFSVGIVLSLHWFHMLHWLNIITFWIWKCFATYRILTYACYLNAFVTSERCYRWLSIIILNNFLVNDLVHEGYYNFVLRFCSLHRMVFHLFFKCNILQTFTQNLFCYWLLIKGRLRIFNET